MPPPTLEEEEEHDLVQWTFDPTLSIVLLFFKVDLMDLASEAGPLYTTKQSNNFALVIIHKTGNFTTSIRELNCNNISIKTNTSSTQSDNSYQLGYMMIINEMYL